MLQEMQIGRGRSEALRSLAERTNLPDLRSFVSAMVQADAFGIPVGQVLRVQSSEIRVKRRQWAEEMAQKVPVKILVPLIFCILPCLFIAVLGPAGISIMDNFSGKTVSVTDVGRVALAARVFTIAALTSLAALAGPRVPRGRPAGRPDRGGRHGAVADPATLRDDGGHAGGRRGRGPDRAHLPRPGERHAVPRHPGR